MMMIRFVPVLMFGATLAACGGGSGTTPTATPTAPTSTTPTPAPTPAPPAPTLYTLSGRVVDGATSAPIAGATLVVVDGANTGKTATTDASGNYSITGLEPSGFSVNATAGAFLSSIKGVGVPTSDALNFSLTQRNFAGNWTGTVQQPGDTRPLAIRFTVSAANMVTTLLVGMCGGGPTFSMVSTTNAIPPPLPIIGGRFTLASSTGPGRSFVGTFTSETSAAGTSLMDLVGWNIPPCSGTYTLTWTATKQ